MVTCEYILLMHFLYIYIFLYIRANIGNMLFTAFCRMHGMRHPGVLFLLLVESEYNHTQYILSIQNLSVCEVSKIFGAFLLLVNRFVHAWEK